MALLPTGSDELLYIETAGLTLTIKGPAYHPSFPGVSVKEKDAVLRVVCDEDYDMRLYGEYSIVFPERFGKTYRNEYKHYPIFFEQQRYEMVIEPADGHTVSFWHENYNIRKRITPVGRKQSILSGEVNFGNDIGFSDFIINLDGKEYLKVTLEVYPSKISYKEDYKAIVTDVTTEVYNLVFEFLKKTYESFNKADTQQSSQVEFFAIIKKIYGKFIKAADMILKNPHHELRTEHIVLPQHKIKRTDNSTIRWLEKHPERVLKTDSGFKVEKALAVKKYVTYDTNENRLTKYMLERTTQRLERFRELYKRLDRESDPVVIQSINEMVNGIRSRRDRDFMREVNAVAGESGMSLVFSMAPGYRELYRYYLLLQHGLSVTGDIFDLSVKDLAVLYEYWCFIKLNSLMKQKYKLVSQDIIRVEGNGLFVSLTKGKSSRVIYENPENGEKITLSYNPKMGDMPTVTQRPDNVLRLQKKGARTNYEYVFDAKYRINPALPGTDYYNNISENPGPEVGDINTMHRYRDAIVFQNEASPYERLMFGAYVLFPYRNEEEYKDHKFYKSIDQVNIGGLPFLPSATTLVTEMLDELIEDSPESAFERAILPAGIEEKLARTDWKKRDVLIGTLSGPDQLKICLEHNCYYLPVSQIAEDKLPLHYIALYQTGSKFGGDAKIQYYGEILSYSIIKRNDIMEDPSDSEEPYYRFMIKLWESLERPIVPKGQGYLPKYTNMFLLKHSSYVSELSLKSGEEYRLYTEIKRRTEAPVINSEDGAVGFELDDSSIVFDNGQINWIIDGGIKEHCAVVEFAKSPTSTFRRFVKRINEYKKGIVPKE